MEGSNKVVNLLKLMKMLEARLSNKIKTAYIDGTTSENAIYSTEKLMTFLEMSLCDFNQVPIFTNFTFDDSLFVDQFTSILVEGAAVVALGSQALLEKGREYNTSNSNIEYSPPRIADLLDSQYSQLYTMHWNKLKYIKKYIKDFTK